MALPGRKQAVPVSRAYIVRLKVVRLSIGNDDSRCCCCWGMAVTFRGCCFCLSSGIVAEGIARPQEVHDRMIVGTTLVRMVSARAWSSHAS